MQKDFHYYATYAAAYIAGYSHEESMAICYSAQFVDWCSKTFLSLGFFLDHAKRNREEKFASSHNIPPIQEKVH